MNDNPTIARIDLNDPKSKAALDAVAPHLILVGTKCQPPVNIIAENCGSGAKSVQIRLVY